MRTATLDVPLEVGQLTETVNVSAEVPQVDVTSKEIGGNITTRELVDRNAAAFRAALHEATIHGRPSSRAVHLASTYAKVHKKFFRQER